MKNSGKFVIKRGLDFNSLFYMVVDIRTDTFKFGKSFIDEIMKQMI